MIEDDKLRELFQAESEEHLQHLDDALLRLEQAPADQALLEEAFREAHSLKGAARMLGLNHIQAPANRIEDELNAARRGAQPLNPATLKRMSVDLEEIRRRALEAVGAASPSEAAAAATRSRPAAAVTREGARDAAAMATEPAPSAPFHIDSVRIDTRKLDKLMTHAGELTVTRTRVAHRLADIDALIDRCDDWMRRSAGQRAALAPAAAMMQDWLGRTKLMLEQLRTGYAEDSARLGSIAVELEGGIREARLLPLSNVFKLFPRMVHDLAQEQGKEVELIIEGGETNADKHILEQIKDPLMHMLRNAVDHGIETPQARAAAGKPRSGRVCIRASHTASSIAIEVSDDGAGLDEQAIARAAIRRGLADEEALAAMTPAQIHALIFSPGMSTSTFVTDISGRGVGMGVVRANVEQLKGRIELRSRPGAGAHIRIALPVTLATMRVLIVEVNGHPYGLPAEYVDALKAVAPRDLYTVEGASAVSHHGQTVSVAALADLLELPRARQRDAAGAAATTPCVMLAIGSESFGVFVDALLDEQEVVLKPQSALLRRVRNVSGATILESGEICMVLNAQDLLASLRRGGARPLQQEASPHAGVARKAVLLAEDSITTRMQETRILEGAGYEVVAAADGLEAWNKLATRAFDAVVTDVMMPNLDGLGLAARIRREARYAELPIVLVTSLASDEDKRRGLEAGANAYITKSAFDQKTLLDCLERLI